MSKCRLQTLVCKPIRTNRTQSRREKYGHPHKTGRTNTAATSKTRLHAGKARTEGWFEPVLRSDT